MIRVYDHPWNKDRNVGPRQALTPSEVKQLKSYLSGQASSHDLCLFMVAIDTMLRAANLVQLKVSDVTFPDGTIRETFSWKQNKSSKPVYPVLTPETRKAIKQWIKESEKRPEHFLFTRNKPNASEPITDGYYRELIKEWVAKIGLFSNDYSGHTMRRTKAIFMYKHGVKIAIISRLLGHKSETATMHYLGIDDATASKAALNFNIFKMDSSISNRSAFTRLEIEIIGERIAARLENKIISLLNQ